jgi:hypothetical protein
MCSLVLEEETSTTTPATTQILALREMDVSLVDSLDTSLVNAPPR